MSGDSVGSSAQCTEVLGWAPGLVALQMMALRLGSRKSVSETRRPC